jgi:hypothetical protein
VITLSAPIEAIWEDFVCDMITPQSNGNGFINIFCHTESIINPKINPVNYV